MEQRHPEELSRAVTLAFHDQTRDWAQRGQGNGARSHSDGQGLSVNPAMSDFHSHGLPAWLAASCGPWPAGQLPLEPRGQHHADGTTRTDSVQPTCRGMWRSPGKKHRPWSKRDGFACHLFVPCMPGRDVIPWFVGAGHGQVGGLWCDSGREGPLRSADVCVGHMS